jgi:hypothetical protein
MERVNDWVVHESSVRGIKLVNDKTGERVMIRKVLAGLCAFSLIYSCSKEDDGLPVIDPVKESDGVVVAFGPKVTKQDWVVSDSTGTDRPETRAWDQQWRDGDKIGMYMIKTADGYDLDDALSTNKQYTVLNHTTGAVTPVSTADLMYYPINDDPVRFVAYSPHRTANAAHEVEYNFATQNTEVLKQGVDFVFHKGSSTHSKSTNTPVALSFDHQFSKVYIRLLQGNSGLSCATATAKLKGMPASAKVNLATLALNANDLNAAITRGTIGDITPQRLGSSTATEAVFEAIVPPHTGTAYTGRTFEFTVEGEVYTHTLPDTFDFASDKAYGFVLTLQERGVPLDRYDGLSNCYIVAPGTTSVQIPIERAITIGGMNPTATATLVKLWDDNNVIPSVPTTFIDTDADRKFTVTAAAGKEGNAVIALQIGTTIYWSWHIWVTGSLSSWTHNGYTIMDRLLGANKAGKTLDCSGMLYQWGRKDPFPIPDVPDNSINSLPLFHGTNNSGDPTVYYVTETNATRGGAKSGVLESIRNPLYFYNRIYEGDWLPYHCDYLWNESTGKKSIYDPCPEGWRIPAFNTNGKVDAYEGLDSPSNGLNGGCNWSGHWYPNTIRYMDNGVRNSLDRYFIVWVGERDLDYAERGGAYNEYVWHASYKFQPAGDHRMYGYQVLCVNE